MKNSDEQINFYRFRTNQDKERGLMKEKNPDWEFQKVQSVYEVKQDDLSNQYDYLQSQAQKKITKNSQNQRDSYYEFKKVAYQKTYPSQRHQQPNQIIVSQLQNPYENPSSKTNNETHIISQNQSLQYLSSQEPSFSNKAEFTVCEDFNIDMISPVKVHSPIYRQQNQKHDWQIVTFSSGSNKPLTLSQKCLKLYQFLQQLKYMKQGLQSKLKQQKVNFTNQIQSIKKVFFQLNIKYEKELLEFTQSQPLPRQFSTKQSVVRDQKSLKSELSELKIYCQKLEQERIISQKKYQLTLKKYQEEIERISEQFEKKMALERSSHFPNFSSQSQCINCPNHYTQNRQKKGLESYEADIWKNRLRQEQENHSKVMKRLEEKVLTLQEEFDVLQKSKNQTEKTLKEKYKQIIYRQAEIEYKIKDIQRRQRDLTMAESLIEKQRSELERKKDKIADFELKVLKEQRRQKNQIKEKEIMTSEYFSNYEKKNFLSKGNHQGDRSDSVSSKGSRIDISARLRQIKTIRNRRSLNCDQNMTSRNSSKDSRSSGYKDYATSRVTLQGRNLKDYGITPPSMPNKQYYRTNNQTIKLSDKLNKLTETLQKELREID